MHVREPAPATPAGNCSLRWPRWFPPALCVAGAGGRCWFAGEKPLGCLSHSGPDSGAFALSVAVGKLFNGFQR